MYNPVYRSILHFRFRYAAMSLKLGGLFTAYCRLNSAFLTYHGNIKCCEVASFIIWAFGVTIWRTIVNVSWRERFRVTIVLDVTQSVGPHRRTDKKENCKKCSCATVLQTINGGVSWDCKSECCSKRLHHTAMGAISVRFHLSSKRAYTTTEARVKRNAITPTKT